MPIPIGARQVPGSPNRVELPSGEIVTRATALSMGAREAGFRSHHEYRGYYREHGIGDQRYFNAWLRTEQGQQAQEIARERGLSKRELRQQLINARNARPHAGGRNPERGGQAYYDFMEDYDLYDQEDWIDY